jgi:hypothetical protein
LNVDFVKQANDRTANVNILGRLDKTIEGASRMDRGQKLQAKQGKQQGHQRLDWHGAHATERPIFFHGKQLGFSKIRK